MLARRDVRIAQAVQRVTTRRVAPCIRAPKREASMIMSPWGLKFLAGGALALSYMGLVSLVRTKRSQRRSILRTFENGAKLGGATRGLKLEREAEAAALSSYLEVPHGLLTAITGPDSSGKSALLRSVIADRPMTTYLDLRQFPVTSDEEFICNFLVSIGYRLPSNDLFRRWLLRERQPKQPTRLIQPVEVDMALERLSEVLIGEKQRRLHDPDRRLPIVIVSGLEALDAPGLHPEGGPFAPLSPAKNDKGKDKGKDKSKPAAPDTTYLSKFINYTIYATDAGLARVMLITSRNFLVDVLDQFPGFRLRREVLDVTYPPAEQVERYLLGPVNEHLAKKGKPALSAADVSAVANTLGGCLTDLNYLFTCVIRGMRPEAVLARLVADAANQTADFLEGILHAAAVAGKEAKVEQERYEQVWQMMELFVERPVVPRSELVAIFEDDPTYLDKLEAARLLLFLENPLETVTSDVPRSWHALATAAVPRLRAAWRLLLADPKMQAQRASVKAQLKKTKAKGDRKDVQEEVLALGALRRDAASELATFATHEAALKNAYGSRYETQRLRAAERLDDLWVKQEAKERELAELEEELEELKDAKKKGKKEKKKDKQKKAGKGVEESTNNTPADTAPPPEAKKSPLQTAEKDGAPAGTS